MLQINGVNVTEMAAKDVRALVNVNPEKLEMMVESPANMAAQNGGSVNPNLDATNLNITATSPILNSAPNSLMYVSHSLAFSLSLWIIFHLTPS